MSKTLLGLALFTFCLDVLSAPVKQELAKTADRDSLQFRLYTRLMKWGTVSSGSDPSELSPDAARHGGVVSAKVAFRSRYIAVDDGKNRLRASYSLVDDPSTPLGFSEEYEASFQLESLELPFTDAPNSLQAVLYEALPAHDPAKIRELSDTDGNHITCQVSGDDPPAYACSIGLSNGMQSSIQVLRVIVARNIEKVLDKEPAVFLKSGRPVKHKEESGEIKEEIVNSFLVGIPVSYSEQPNCRRVVGYSRQRLADKFVPGVGRVPGEKIQLLVEKEESAPCPSFTVTRKRYLTTWVDVDSDGNARKAVVFNSNDRGLEDWLIEVKQKAVSFRWLW